MTNIWRWANAQARKHFNLLKFLWEKKQTKTHSGKNTLLLNEKQAAFPDQSHLGKLGNTATDTVPTIFTKLCLQQIWTTGM